MQSGPTEQTDGVFNQARVRRSSVRRRTSFDQFLQIISSFPLRSTIEYSDDEPFHSRWTSARIGDGVAIRWSCAPHKVRRTENDIADSQATGFGVLHVRSGQVGLRQTGKTIVANGGDVVIYDADAPSEVAFHKSRVSDFAFLSIPRSAVSLQNLQAPIALRSGPLVECVDYLSRVLADRNARELTPVYGACLNLLDAELLASLGRDASFATSLSGSNEMLRRLLMHIDHDLANPSLSPASLADKFGISVRYVHKLFAMEGSTCQSHISDRRLLQARRDLLSAEGAVRISTVGYRWGFLDPSSFGRAFRKRFGYSPRQLRNIVRV